MLERKRKPGRKPGFSFGRPLLDKTLRVTAAHKERAAELVTIGHTADDILRLAIEVGLSELEHEKRQTTRTFQ